MVLPRNQKVERRSRGNEAPWEKPAVTVNHHTAPPAACDGRYQGICWLELGRRLIMSQEEDSDRLLLIRSRGRSLSAPAVSVCSHAVSSSLVCLCVVATQSQPKHP